MRKFWVTALAALLVGCSTCADAFASDLGPYGYRGTKDARVGVSEPAAYNWTGLYVGLGAGYGWGDNAVEFTPGLAAINGLSSRGPLGNARVGADVQLGTSPFLVGVFGGYGLGSMDFDASAMGMGAVNVNLKPTWHAGGRAGVVVFNRALVYGGYAYQVADLDITAPASMCATPGVACKHNLAGHQLLGGVELALTKNLSFAVEYNYTQFEKATVFTSGPTAGTIDADTHAIMARLNLRTNSLFGQ